MKQEKLMNRKIKKAAVGVLAAAIMMLAGAASALAAEPGCGRNFVDADNNGICDYAGRFCRYIDSDQDGVCDNYGTRQGRGFRGRCGR